MGKNNYKSDVYTHCEKLKKYRVLVCGCQYFLSKGNYYNEKKIMKNSNLFKVGLVAIKMILQLKQNV